MFLKINFLNFLNFFEISKENKNMSLVYRPIGGSTIFPLFNSFSFLPPGGYSEIKSYTLDVFWPKNASNV